MKMKFKKLFQFQIDSGYFPNRDETLFYFAPTRPCCNTLKQHQITFRSSSNGFFLFCQVTTTNEDKNQPKMLIPPRDKLDLTFAAYSAHPNLACFSALPLQMPRHSAYIFNNLDTTLHDDSGLYLIPNTPEAFAAQKYRLPVYAKKFSLPCNAIQGRETLRLFTCGDDTPLPGQALQITDQTIYVDLTDYPAGQYEIRDRKEKRLQFYADNQLSCQTPFALLEFQVNRKVPPQSRFIEINSGCLSFKHFLISIPSRLTTWRYYVICKYSQLIDASKLRIDAPLPTHAFLPGTPIQLKNGVKATCFVSENPISLTQAGVKGIELNLHEDGRENRTLISNLPNPNEGSIAFDKNKPYSDIYVYI